MPLPPLEQFPVSRHIPISLCAQNPTLQSRISSGAVVISADTNPLPQDEIMCIIC